MDIPSPWWIRFQALRAAVQRHCEVLADRTAPRAQRERAAAAFAVLWPRFCAHVRAMPAA
jgi:hypothetical protein